MDARDTQVKHVPLNTRIFIHLLQNLFENVFGILYHLNLPFVTSSLTNNVMHVDFLSSTEFGRQIYIELRVKF